MEKNKKSSMYDWKIAMYNAGLDKEARDFEFDRLADDERVVQLGLPYFKRIVIPYKDFIQEPEELKEFMLKYEEFMIRVLPSPEKKDLSRRYNKEGIYNFKDCKNFLDYLFSKDKELIGNEKFYNISLTEHEFTDICGVLVSNQQRIILESKKSNKNKGGLDALCGGENPNLSYIIDLSIFGYLNEKTSWIPQINKKNKRISEIMLRALSYVELTRDRLNPFYMRGYFEWLHAKKSDRIIFWDYKDKEIFYL